MALLLTTPEKKILDATNKAMVTGNNVNLLKYKNCHLEKYMFNGTYFQQIDNFWEND